VYDAEEEMHAAAEEPKPADTKKMEDMTSEEIEQILYPKVLPLLARTVDLYGTAFKGSS
jgi:hypothetical protein